MKYKLMNEEIFILRSRDTIFVFKSAYEPNSEINKVCWFETNSRKICWWWKYRNISEDGLNLNLCDDFDCHCFQEMGAHLVVHGDGVKDVAFSVEDLDGIMITCKKKGVRWYDGWHYDWHVWLTCLVGVIGMFGWRDDWHDDWPRQKGLNLMNPWYEKIHCHQIKVI